MSAPPRGIAYGVAAVFIALALIVSGVAVFYHSQYDREVRLNGQLSAELQQAGQRYGQTAGQYDALVAKYNSEAQAYSNLSQRYQGAAGSFGRLAALYNESAASFVQLSATFESLASGYNTSIALLAQTVAHLNTSQPVYKSASGALAGLWGSYTTLSRQYAQEVKSYESLSAEFESVASHFGNGSVPATWGPALEVVPVRLFGTHVLIDFGNGTARWYNGTAVQPGWNLYVTTLVIANGSVDATWYPQYGEHFVSGIWGVGDTPARSWFLWEYNRTTSSWGTAQVGADQIQVYNGSTYAWTYCRMDASFNPLCSP